MGGSLGGGGRKAGDGGDDDVRDGVAVVQGGDGAVDVREGGYFGVSEKTVQMLVLV